MKIETATMVRDTMVATLPAVARLQNMLASICEAS